MTGWEVRYRCTFVDFLDHTWRVDLLLYGYEGAIEEVGPGGFPVELNTLGEGDDEGGIKPREWTIEFMSQTNFQFINLFTCNARTYLMKLYKDNVLTGTGWVDPDNYSEEFTSVPYPSRIHCHDGLGELKDIDLSFTEDDNPTGAFNRSLLFYIYKALQATGLNLPINIASDITFKKKDGTIVTSGVFTEIHIDWRLFRTGESSYWSYYDILTSILGSFEGLRLFQESGAWWIERAGTMKTAEYDVEVYVNGEVGTPFKKTAIQPLTSNSVALPLRFGTDAELTIVPGWKKFRIAQEYGVKESILKAFNLDGNFYPDQWRTYQDLWYWTRSNIDLGHFTGKNFFKILGLVHDHSLSIPWANFLQSDTVYVTGSDDIKKLFDSWRGSTESFDGGNIGMELSIRYLCAKRNFVAADMNLRLWLTFDMIDENGNYWKAFNSGDDPDTGYTISEDRAWFAMMNHNIGGIEIVPKINEWTEYKIKIPQFYWDAPETDSLGFFVKIHKAVYAQGEGDFMDGLYVSNIKLGFYDLNDEKGQREIEETVDSDNRFVPGNVEVKFGETPGHWGMEEPYTGFEYTNRHVFLDSDGHAINDFGTVSGGIGSGLLAGVMRDALAMKHRLPLFKLRGSVRDNVNSMDFTSALQDYDSRNYIPTGMSRDVGMCELQAEWIQLKEVEQGAAGEFNWDFSNDFNIGT